jgi:hypothetical protein
MSDGWGDASGIEGNYEDNDVGETNETNETNETTETNPSNRVQKTSETRQTKETSETKTNIKSEWNGRTIYIPDGILDELEDTYLESQLKIRKAGQNKFKKNRHFYPLLVQFGLEALSEADADEIQTRLSSIGDE